MFLTAIATDEASELATILSRQWQNLPRPSLDC